MRQQTVAARRDRPLRKILIGPLSYHNLLGRGPFRPNFFIAEPLEGWQMHRFVATRRELADRAAFLLSAAG